MIKIKNFKQKTAALIAAILITGSIMSITTPKIYGDASSSGVTPIPTAVKADTNTATSNNLEVPKEANSLVIRHGYTSAPIYDVKTNKVIGKMYEGFSINILSQNNGRAYFTLPLLNKKNLNKSAPQKVYVPIKYLTKAYIEPTAVISIISLDRIVLHKNAPIYNHEGKKIAVFKNKIGPMNFIQKTDKGYTLTLDNNLILIKDKDVDFQAYKAGKTH